MARRAGLVMGAVALVAATMSGVSSAPAQEKDCTGSPGIDWDIQIGACTAAIQSGRWQGPNLAWAFGNRGKAYAQKDQYDLAIRDYEQAVRLDPNNAVLTKDLDTVQKLKALQTAMATPAETPQTQPGGASSDYARCKDGGTDLRGDLAACTRLIASNSFTGANLGDLYRFRSNWHQVLANYTAAVADLSEAIRLSVRRPAAHQAELYKDRACAKISKGDRGGAKADFAKVKALDPSKESPESFCPL